MDAIESRTLMKNILLETADKYFDAYLSDNSKTDLTLAEAQINAAYKRGAVVDSQVNRLLDICYALDNE